MVFPAKKHEGLYVRVGGFFTKGNGGRERRSGGRKTPQRGRKAASFRFLCLWTLRARQNGLESRGLYERDKSNAITLLRTTYWAKGIYSRKSGLATM